MAQYDGSIRINTQIDSKNASAQLMSLENRIVKTADKIASLRSKMDSLKDVQIPTQEYKSIETDIAKAETELGKLIEKQAQMQSEGKDSGTAWDRLNQRIQASKDYIEYAREEMQQLVNEGKAFTLGKDTDQYAKLGQQLQYAEIEMDVLNQRHDELIAKQDKNVDGYKRIGKSARDGAKVANKAVKGMSDNLKIGLKNILKYGLGIRSLYALVNKIRAGIKGGFSNLYNDKNMTAFKNQVDSLKASLLTLKNSFAAAFRPLIDVAIPYLQKAIEYMTRFLDVVGKLFAAIRGQNVYTKAIKQTTAALKDQNKAQNKQLSSLDILNNQSSSDGDADDDGTVTMFEEVPIDTKILDFLQKIKEFMQPVIEYAEKLKGIFAQGFFDGLGDWEPRLESIKVSASSIKDTLIGIWTDPEVLSAVNKFNESAVYTLGSLAGSVASIGLTIATNLVGGISLYLEQNKERISEFLVSMFDIGADIDQLIAEFAQAISFIFEPFGSENGQQLTANLIGIFSNSFMELAKIVGKLARDILKIIIKPFVKNKEKFQTALDGFLGILTDITGTIKDSIDETFARFSEMYDEHLKPFFDSIADGLSDTAGIFLDFWNTDVQPILDEWADGFDKLWKNHIQPMLNKFVNLIGKVADLLKTVWEKLLKPLIDWIIKNVLPVLLPIIKGIGDAIGSAFALISDVVGSIFDILGGLIDFIINIFSGDWGKAWDSIVGVFKGIFNLIPTIIEGILNTAISIINGLIGGINKITGAVGIPSIPTIPKVSIPRLATGTVVPPNNEFLAVLGDNKREPEIVSPLSTIEQAVTNAIHKSGGFGGGEITIKVPVEIDGRMLFELIKKFDLEQYRRTGKPSFQM